VTIVANINSAKVKAENANSPYSSRLNSVRTVHIIAAEHPSATGVAYLIIHFFIRHLLPFAFLLYVDYFTIEHMYSVLVGFLDILRIERSID